MTDLLTELCRLNGVSGDEDEVMRAILDHIRAIPQRQGGEITLLDRGSPLRNLTVFKRGRKSTGNKLMLCAHMDEVGIIVTRITDEGFLKFGFVGGVDRRVAIGKPVVIGRGRVPGVIGLKAIHLTTKEERKKAPKADSLYIDIGAKDRESAEKLVELGDCGAFVCEPEIFGDGLFKAKAIDDRVGCAVMLKLLEEELPLDVTFAFTAQEEVGCRGAFGAGFSVTPEIALVLETTTAADLPGVEDHRKVCAPGKGPVISYMDGGTVYDRRLFETLRTLAEDSHIPWQTKEYIAGGNDAQAIQRVKSGVRVAALSAAVRYLHAPASVGSAADFENMLKLTRLFLAGMAEQM
ncbi:MAG: M42 family metallopeptidase [Lawsonibacter sp.]|nr:M42 family metallopeptidase [Lawsonibacter sp.]